MNSRNLSNLFGLLFLFDHPKERERNIMTGNLFEIPLPFNMPKNIQLFDYANIIDYIRELNNYII